MPGPFGHHALSRWSWCSARLSALALGLCFCTEWATAACLSAAAGAGGSLGSPFPFETYYKTPRIALPEALYLAASRAATRQASFAVLPLDQSHIVREHQGPGPANGTTGLSVVKRRLPAPPMGRAQDSARGRKRPRQKGVPLITDGEPKPGFTSADEFMAEGIAGDKNTDSSSSSSSAGFTTAHSDSSTDGSEGSALDLFGDSE